MIKCVFGLFSDLRWTVDEQFSVSPTHTHMKISARTTSLSLFGAQTQAGIELLTSPPHHGLLF